MRRWLSICALLTAGPLGAAGSVDLTADFVSQYVFRGQSLRQGVSVQPTLHYDLLDNLSLALWANFRLANSLAVSETDYSVQWTALTLRPAALTLGGVVYDRGTNLGLRSTSELFGGLDFDVPGRPAVYLWYDCAQRTGLYAELSARQRWLLADYRGTVDLGAALGFDAGRVNGFHDARLSLGFTRHLGDWQLRPSVDLHFPAAAVDAQGFQPVFRVSATRSF
ncbi:MAG: hypothetical protein IT204_24545 [Fimbriimonadaceae bacterium]|nr:hypothetical protein [Fimbriimonadaceae bacterium]